MNTNTSVNSEITTGTSRAITSETSSRMSRELEEVRIDLNVHVLEAINSAIEEKVLSTIQSPLNTHSANSIAKLDHRSDGPHQIEDCGKRRKTRVYFPKVNCTNTHKNNTRERSVDTYESDGGYDT